MTIRLGQKLCNWILEQGYSREDVHTKLFYMSDEEFLKVIKMDVDYEIPTTPDGDKKIMDQVRRVLDGMDRG